MNYKTKANRVGTVSLAALAKRIIETVDKSGIDTATVSKQFVNLVSVNNRYQLAVLPGNNKPESENTKKLFKARRALFSDIYDYVEGNIKSPQIDVKTAAELVFNQLSKFGRNFSNVKIADQSLIYIRVIEGLKNPELALALDKIMLTERVEQLNQLQHEYEVVYLNRGNVSSTKVAPSNIRMEMQNAVKLYVDELKWMVNTYDTEAWHTLLKNVEQRFSEVNVTVVRRKVETQKLTENALTAN
jgi:hypothetical protein